jgi:tetratricopeptide (TPR) repeat protein
MRVPLIVAPAASGPASGSASSDGVEPPVGAFIVESQVRSIDIMPTILDLAAIDARTPLDGIPLRDASGEPPSPSAAICYMETFAPWYSFQWSPLRAVRTSEWKFIEAPKSELYRIAVDPRENDNLYQGEPRARRAAWASALSAAGVERAASNEAEMDPQTVEGLRALGYIGAGQDVDKPRPETGANPKLPNPADLIGIYFQYFSPALERFTRGDYAAAVKFAKDGLARDPANIQGLITLGHAQYRLGDAAEARATYERIAALDRENSTAHFMIAAIAHRSNDVATAVREYRAAIAIDPMLLEARHDLAILLMAEGKTAEAETLLRETIAADSTFGAAHRTLGNIYSQAGREADALDAYVRALIANPNDYEVERMVTSAAKDVAASEAVFRRLEESWRGGERSQGLAVALAEVAYVRGEKALARRVADEALAATPSAALYRVRAWINKNDGRADLEIADLVAGVRAEPENPEAHANLASNYRSKERWDDARREYEECLELDPRNEHALVGLGIVFAETNQLGKAIEMWEQALRVNPNSPAKDNLDKARKMLPGQGVGE